MTNVVAGQAQKAPVNLEYDPEQLSVVLRTLSPKQEKLIRLRYGIGCEREHWPGEIAEHYKVSARTVNVGLRDARTNLRSFGLGPRDLARAGAFQQAVLATGGIAALRPRRAVTQVVTAVQALVDASALDASAILRLSPREFEEFIAEIWSRFGYQVELTARTRDGGRDVVAVRSAEADIRILIECKRYSPDNKVGVLPVRALYGVKTDERATKAILATTSSFTSGANKFFEMHRLELEPKDYEGVCEWAKKAARYRENPVSGLWLPRT